MNFAFKDKYKDFFGKLFVGNPKAGASGAGSLIGVSFRFLCYDAIIAQYKTSEKKCHAY